MKELDDYITKAAEHGWTTTVDYNKEAKRTELWSTKDNKRWGLYFSDKAIELDPDYVALLLKSKSTDKYWIDLER